MDKIPFYQLTLPELTEHFLEKNLPLSGAKLLYNWHYKKAETLPCIHNLANVTIDYLKDHFDFTLPEIEKVQLAQDLTVKFLVRLSDGKKVEMVLLPFQGKYTLCLSSQVGCRMGCSFCFTGKFGLTRNLSSQEIIGQFILAKKWLKTHRPTTPKVLNVVFMGQGEPLDNFENVAKAITIMLSQNGLSLAPHKITVSTAGLLPGILRFKKDMPPVNLALSLHSPFDEERSKIIPLNRAYPLETLLPHLDAIPEGKNRFITYEYVLINGFNDSDKHAHALGKMLEGMKAFLNLIPVNPYPGSSDLPPTDEKIEEFKKIVESYQVPTTWRSAKGQDILAACGQLSGDTP